MVVIGPKWEKVVPSGTKSIAMLLGQFVSTIGDKARTAFPKKFRDVLGQNVILTQGFEKSLIAVSEEGWKALLEGTEGLPFTDEAARETQRFLLGGAAFVELDEKGRFVMPDYLRKYADIQEEIVFIGMHRYVEIWDKKRWEEYNKHLGENINTITKRLNERVPAQERKS